MKDSELAGDIMQELRLLLKKVRTARVAHGVALTYNESLILATLRDNPAITAKELAEQLHSDKSTMSRQLTQLERNGYVEKHRRSDNGRFNDIALTPAGQAALADADATWVRLVDDRLHDWSDTDRRDFLRLLQRYNATS